MLPSRGEYERRPLSGVRWLAIHHSAVGVDSTSRSIADYHVNVQGWEGIGYHYVVHWDGTIDYVGDIETSRANVALINDRVIGICIPGNWEERWPPTSALTATRALVAWLLTLVPQAQVVGHREIAQDGWATTCPGPLWEQWRQAITD